GNPEQFLTPQQLESDAIEVPNRHLVLDAPEKSSALGAIFEKTFRLLGEWKNQEDESAFEYFDRLYRQDQITRDEQKMAFQFIEGFNATDIHQMSMKLLQRSSDASKSYRLKRGYFSILKEHYLE